MWGKGGGHRFGFILGLQLSEYWDYSLTRVAREVLVRGCGTMKCPECEFEMKEGRGYFLCPICLHREEVKNG